jgi:hypothetical protein
MKGTWKPVAGGILSIIGGVFAILLGVWFLPLIHYQPHWDLSVLGYFGTGYSALLGLLLGWIFGLSLSTMVAIIVGIDFALGLLAIVAGIYVLKRKMYYLAIASCVGVLFCSFFFIVWGVPAWIFIRLSEKEFEKPLQGV